MSKVEWTAQNDLHKMSLDQFVDDVCRFIGCDDKQAQSVRDKAQRFFNDYSLYNVRTVLEAVTQETLSKEKLIVMWKYVRDLQRRTGISPDAANDEGEAKQSKKGQGKKTPRQPRKKRAKQEDDEDNDENGGEDDEEEGDNQEDETPKTNGKKAKQKTPKTEKNNDDNNDDEEEGSKKKRGRPKGSAKSTGKSGGGGAGGAAATTPASAAAGTPIGGSGRKKGKRAEGGVEAEDDEAPESDNRADKEDPSEQRQQRKREDYELEEGWVWPKSLPTLKGRRGGVKVAYECHWENEHVEKRMCSAHDLVMQYGDRMVRRIEDYDTRENVDFAIDKLIGERELNGVKQYCVRWKGYPTAFDTWQPRETLGGAAKQYIDDLHKAKK